jgi:hypothetical protein
MKPATHTPQRENELAQRTEADAQQHLRTSNASHDPAAQDPAPEADPGASGELPGPGNPAPDTGLKEAQAQAGEAVPAPTRSATTEEAADPREPGAKERMKRMKRLERRISG